MAQSSDALVKHELMNLTGLAENLISRIFPESSNQDQIDFVKGGLTFQFDGKHYGSCDAAWVIKESWKEPGTNFTYDYKPVLALEATDALNRGSNGNAQYQRFHHVLGAIRCGIPGIYYFRKGQVKIQPDLFGMAVNASKFEPAPYFILDDLNDVKNVINACALGRQDVLDGYQKQMEKIYSVSLQQKYKGDIQEFARKRSTFIGKNYVVKYSARNMRSFTDSSQRGGHIAVGEMYLSKYMFPDKHLFYFFPRISRQQLLDLDRLKSTDKEWALLRHEKNVTIVTSEDFDNVDSTFYKNMKEIETEPLKGGSPKRLYVSELERFMYNLRAGEWKLNEGSGNEK